MLTNLGANGEGLRTEVAEGLMSVSGFFKAQINLRLAVDIDEKYVREQLEQIVNKLMVEVYSYET